MNIAILCPFRADGGHRDRLWEFTKARWERFGWPIVLGESPPGPFNRSAAVNDAARKASDADVFVIVDNDVIANPEAVRTAVDIAYATDRLVVSHNERVMLNKAGTDKVLAGYEGPWRVKQMVQTVYTDSVSCCIAVSRKLFELVGGFDERFVGWNAEDSAFEVACVTLSGRPYVRLASELFHLDHPLQPEAQAKNPRLIANKARLERYRAAAGDVDAVRALLNEPVAEMPTSRIPRILHRTVPAETSEQVEAWWAKFQEIHQGWTFHTWRDPLDPADWPLTAHAWKRCKSGAQRAGLIRLEYLVTYGGFHIDADMEPVRSLEPLTQCSAVAAWEDLKCVPDAFLGCEPNHPAFMLMLEKAVAAVEGGADAWCSGPGVSTEVLPGRPDVVVFPPSVAFDVHYLERAKLETKPHPPYAYMRHHWHGSWLSDKQRASIEKRQR